MLRDLNDLGWYPINDDDDDDDDDGDDDGYGGGGGGDDDDDDGDENDDVSGGRWAEIKGYMVRHPSRKCQSDE